MARFAAADGTGLHFADAGNGLPLLCLPGLTRNGADFDHVAPHLTDVRMIRLDARGRGRSDHADPATYTVVQEARDVLDLMDHLGLARAAILGTSRGGLVAMMLAATAHDRLIGVALNDIGPVIGAAGLATIAAYIGKPPPQRTWQAAAEARARTWTAFADVPHERWLAEVRAHYDETADGLILRHDPRLAEAFAATPSPQPDLWPLFDALAGLPLAVIRGANSDLLAQDTAAEMARRRPDMFLAEIRDRGHVPFLDEPGAVAALHDWLKACR